VTRSAADCYAKAAELLSRRPHFRRELEAKLFRRRFTPEQVDDALGRLERRGLVDDLATAREFAEGALRRRKYGPRRLRAELARRGLAESDADAVIGDVFGEGDGDLAREVAGDWLARHADAKRDSLARHLDRKGFRPASIAAVLDELPRDDG
jgi:regulatory protein